MSNDKKIPVNGISISYEDSGKGDTPIIFIHGFPFNKSMWQPQFDFLKKTNRVIIYDIRGFGGSTSDDEKFSIDLFADDLIKLMNELKIDQAIACGLSMGGYILLSAVERYQARFKAIILSDTQCLADSKEGMEKRYKSIDEIKKNGLNDFAKNFAKGAFSKKAFETKKDLTDKIEQVILSNSSQSITGALDALAQRKETCSALKNIMIPTLIICGDEDELTPLTRSEFLFNSISGATMHTIKEAGHLSNLEQPEVFNQHIYNFILNLIP